MLIYIRSRPKGIKVELAFSTRRLPCGSEAIGVLEASIALKLVLVAWTTCDTDTFSKEVGIDLVALKYNACKPAAVDHDETEVSFRGLWLNMAMRLRHEGFVNEFTKERSLGNVTIDDVNANAHLTPQGVEVLVKAAWLPEMVRLKGLKSYPRLTRDESDALRCLLTPEVNSPGEAWKGYKMDLPPHIERGMLSLQRRNLAVIQGDRAYLTEALLEHLAIATMA